MIFKSLLFCMLGVIILELSSILKSAESIRHQLEDCNNIAQSESIKAMPLKGKK